MCELFIRTFPGIPASAAHARAWATEILTPRITDDEAIGDTQLVISELVTNALHHTTSGGSEHDTTGRAEARLRAILGRVHLRLFLTPRRIRVEVTDAGTVSRTGGSSPHGDSWDDAGAPGPIVRCPDPDAEHGRGLALVDHLAQRWFSRGDNSGRTVTADLTHQPASTAQGAAPTSTGAAPTPHPP
ncbi:ATP-binding protein [Lipingzhangella sp. LS1_29]|uniref:ATP-binding protein n=1 Tax=Lipingzhangella rawalii TaxID=2055835 RepID=A0ABU2HCW2_9ACTN|nr:ATP-binding protein [Lipingzhangella rawalii]MDS1272645.1 ATP-binding protein [Lipingzhangella rawalii]